MELMNRSDEIGELATALCAAQAEFSAVPKTGTNPFFNSKYAPLQAVVAQAQPILTKHGLAVTQLLGHDDGGDTLSTCLLHKSGQFLADNMRMRPVKDDPQAQGSATTYARRYSYMAILGLVADDDDDGNSAAAQSGSTGTVRATEPPSDKQLAFLARLHKQNNPPERTMRAMLDHVGAPEVEYKAGWSGKLNKGQVSALIDIFQSGSLPDPEAQDIPTDLDPDDNAAKPLAEQLGDTSDLPFDVAAPGETVRHTEEDLRRAAGIAKRHPVDAASTATSGEGDEHD